MRYSIVIISLILVLATTSSSANAASPGGNSNGANPPDTGTGTPAYTDKPKLKCGAKVTTDTSVPDGCVYPDLRGGAFIIKNGVLVRVK